jgi:DNA-directed RNA polymerase subunit RPC12/RpoP
MTAGDTFSCPECGAPLTTDGKSTTITCPFCGASVIVPDSLRPKQAPSAVDVSKTAAAHTAAAPVPARRGSRAAKISGYLIIAFMVLLLFGLGVVFNSGSGSDQSSLSQVSEPVATATVAAFQRPLSATLPRQVTYAGIVYTLTKGEIDNQDLSYDPPVNRNDQAFARLFFKLQNNSRDVFYMDPNLFKLHLANNNDYALDPGVVLDNDFRAPPPQSASTTSLIFPVPGDADWTGAILTIGAPGSEPAPLPLSGEMPTPAFPAQLQSSGNVQASAQGLDYQVQSATLDLDDGTQRVDQGKRYLKLEMQVTDSGSKYGANISQDNFRLIIDGTASEPVDAPIEVVDYQTTLKGEVIFEIPAEATNATLQVGDVTSDQPEFGQIQLDLSQSTPIPNP